MNEKVNLTGIPVDKFFYGYIYPVLAKEFLFSDKLKTFMQLVNDRFKITTLQHNEIVQNWYAKEKILS